MHPLFLLVASAPPTVPAWFRDPTPAPVRPVVCQQAEYALDAEWDACDVDEQYRADYLRLLEWRGHLMNWSAGMDQRRAIAWPLAWAQMQMEQLKAAGVEL